GNSMRRVPGSRPPRRSPCSWARTSVQGTSSACTKARRGSPSMVIPLSAARPALEHDAVEDDGPDRSEIRDAVRGVAGDEQQVRPLPDRDLAEVGVFAAEKAGVLPGRGPERAPRRKGGVGEL